LQKPPFTSPSREPLVAVTDAKIFAWWWKESVARAGIDGDNPPPKTEYVELKEWRYDGEGLTTAPHEIDLVSAIRNNSRAEVEVSVRFYLSRQFDGISTWTAKAAVFHETRTIRPQETVDLKVENFDISSILNEQQNGNAISGLRLVVEIADAKGNQLSKKETTAKIVMGI